MLSCGARLLLNGPLVGFTPFTLLSLPMLAEIFLPSIVFRNAFAFPQDRPTEYKVGAGGAGGAPRRRRGSGRPPLAAARLPGCSPAGPTRCQPLLLCPQVYVAPPPSTAVMWHTMVIGEFYQQVGLGGCGAA